MITSKCARELRLEMMTSDAIRPYPGTDSDIIPIFVLGVQRSGTTWISNILCAHPKITGVMNEEKFGTFESLFFSHFATHFGDLQDSQNFERFMDHFTRCDFFLLTGIDRNWLLEKRPTRYEDVFRLIMNEVARRNNAHCWLEKSPPHTLLAEDLWRYYPDAWFVCIRRKLLDVILSSLTSKSEYRKYGSPETVGEKAYVFVRLFRLSFRYVLYQKAMDALARKNDRCIVVEYEALLNDRLATIQKLITPMGIEFSYDMLTTKYRPNANKRKHTVSKAMFDWKRKMVAVIACRLLFLVPFAALKWVHGTKSERKGLMWPPWCWRTMPQWSIGQRPGPS